MSQTSGKRDTFTGSPEDLAAVIAPYAIGPRFFEYSEGKTVTKVNCRQLFIVTQMWRDLHELHSNWSFQITKLKTAMTIVWDEKHDTWAQTLADNFKDEWIHAMANRIRTALAHLQKALGRGLSRPLSPWLHTILNGPLSGDSAPPESADSATQPGDEQEEEDEEEQEEEEEEEDEGEEQDKEVEEDPGKPVAKKKNDRRPPDEPSVNRRLVDERAGDAAAQAVEYVYGYCWERNQAWRSKANSTSKNPTREHTVVFAKEGAADTDYVFCQWGLSPPREVKALTVLEFKTHSLCLWQTTRGPLWTGNLGKFSLKLTKSCRLGVESLVINKFPSTGNGKGTQLLQIVVANFGGLSHDNREAAVKLGILICEQLSKGTLKDDPSVIRAARDKHMMKKGGGSLRKKPAGQEADEEEEEEEEAQGLRKKPAAKGQEAKGLRKKPATKEQEADEEEEEEKAQEEEEEEEAEEEEEEEADEAEENQKPAHKKPAQKRPAGKDNPLPAGNPPAKKQKQHVVPVNEAMELARRELDDHPPPSCLFDFGPLYDDASRPAEAAPQK
jgi:hypothetical protein